MEAGKKQEQIAQVSGLRSQVNLIQSELTSKSSGKAADYTAFISDLEDAYETLKSNAIESGKDERVITAMINNYRLRIQLLEKLLTELVDAQSDLGKTNNTPSQSSDSPNSNQFNTQEKAPNCAS
ncbi:MAG: GTP cyclohydrolase III [Limisphaerales bacterium]|jgi:GTP cyclohydrolase III